MAVSMGFASVMSFGQEPNDCINAIGVCSNGVINENSHGSGADDFAQSGNNQGCLAGKEHQSVWLYIQVASGSTLGFSISPVDGLGEDYDFAVYGPNVSCSNLGNPIRCSWADAYCAYCPYTGLNATSNDYSEGAVGDGFVKWLYVNPGETYYILVDNYSSSSTGFTLNWTGNASLDCSVTENCPTVDLGNDISICENGSSIIGVDEMPMDSYLWSTGETTSEITVYQPGTYWLDVTRDGCTVRDEIQVFTGNSLDIDIGQDTTICTGGNVLLNAYHEGALSYSWQDGSTSSTYNVQTTGVYWVDVFDGQCTSRDSVVVSVYPVPVFDLGPDTFACEGTEYILDASTTPISDYLWLDGSTSPVYTITQSGTYSVTASNDGCSFSDEVTINIIPTPEIDLGEDTSICEGNTLTLDMSAINASAYQWQDGSTDGQFTIEETGTYTLTASFAHCTATDEISVEVLPAPVFNLGEDTSVCGSGLVLSALSPFAVNYVWQNGSDGPDFNVSQSGSYAATASNEACTFSDTIEVTVHEVPVFDLGMDTTAQQVPLLLCEGANVLLNAWSPGATSYQWQDGSGGATFNADETGIYTATAYNEFCSYSDNISLTFSPAPEIDLGNDTALCFGSSLVLDASFEGATGYIWQDGSTVAMYEVQQSGIYTVTVVAGNCFAADEITIEYLEAPAVDLGNDTTLCEGVSISLNAYTDAATEYLWQDGSTTPSFLADEAGSYSVTVSNGSCSAEDEIYIEITGSPEFDLGDDITLCSQDEFTFYAPEIDGASFYWQDMSTDPSFTVQGEDAVILVAETLCGTASDTVLIYRENCGCDIVFPTAFTPNGDGQNDDFYPFVTCDNVMDYELEIYNRWGELVYRTNDIEASWIPDDNATEMDTYIWAINYKAEMNGEVFKENKSGSVLLLK